MLSFSDDTIRQFLLGQLRANDRTAFEHALFGDASLEQRTRLEEIALADDYATQRLRKRDLKAFEQTFRFTFARRKQLEISLALSECFAQSPASRRAQRPLKHPVWKLTFATMILIMLFATIWVATKESRIVQRFIPQRNHPAAATTPTPGVAHHAERASEPATHREELPAPPSHEAAINVIVLDSTTSQENAPTITLATVRDGNVQLQLLLSERVPATYVAELMTSAGKVVYSTSNISAAANADRVNFDFPPEHAAGDFQIKLTRASDGKQLTYFLRFR